MLLLSSPCNRSSQPRWSSRGTSASCRVYRRQKITTLCDRSRRGSGGKLRKRVDSDEAREVPRGHNGWAVEVWVRVECTARECRGRHCTARYKDHRLLRSVAGASPPLRTGRRWTSSGQPCLPRWCSASPTPPTQTSHRVKCASSHGPAANASTRESTKESTRPGTWWWSSRTDRRSQLRSSSVRRSARFHLHRSRMAVSTTRVLSGLCLSVLRRHTVQANAATMVGLPLDDPVDTEVSTMDVGRLVYSRDVEFRPGELVAVSRSDGSRRYGRVKLPTNAAGDVVVVVSYKPMTTTKVVRRQTDRQTDRRESDKKQTRESAQRERREWLVSCDVVCESVCLRGCAVCCDAERGV
mmetsp:Transcript_53631/g.116593  ORF Transcript_53631/g.116593 Transcript_53631/m.116593 type:complete len:354 (+) Transcript_53631:222-1283(+)